MGPEKQLTAYLKEVADRPFEWGVHDCLTFTNTACHRMHGHGWGDDLLGRYMRNGKPLGRDAMREEYGYSSLVEMLDGRLTRVGHIPPTGAVITTRRSRRWITGVALGICTGRRGAFVGADGLLFMPLTDIENGWVYPNE